MTSFSGDVLGFRKNELVMAADRHIEYYNRHFGYVLRPMRSAGNSDSYAPGLHHFCLRVDSAADVERTSIELQAAGIAATTARLYPEYAPDYGATFFIDPDGIRLEVTTIAQSDGKGTKTGSPDRGGLDQLAPWSGTKTSPNHRASTYRAWFSGKTGCWRRIRIRYVVGSTPPFGA